jgi:hypothetical protein
MPRRSITIDETGESFTFDNITSENYTAPVEVTRQTLEDGATITNHANINPRNATINYLVTETPPSGSGGPPPGQRIERAREFLYRARGKLLIAETSSFGVLTNRIFEDMPHEIDQRDGVSFSLSLVEIRFAQSKTVQFPDDLAVERHQGRIGSEKNAGRKTSQAQTETQNGEEVDNPTASRIGDELGTSLEYLTEGTG